MGSRWQRFLAEVGRFLAVGGLATIVALILFNWLVHGYTTGRDALLHDHVILAYVLANTVGMVISYRGSRSWAFRDRPPRQADGGRLAFLVINVVKMTLPIGCLWFSRNVLGLDDPYSDNVAANMIGLFLGMVARFYLFRTLVFQKPVVLAELKQHPLQVFELGGLDIEPLDPPVDLSEEPTDPSTSGPARQQAP